jgi:hypothetical protein
VHSHLASQICHACMVYNSKLVMQAWSFFPTYEMHSHLALQICRACRPHVSKLVMQALLLIPNKECIHDKYSKPAVHAFSVISQLNLHSHLVWQICHACIPPFFFYLWDPLTIHLTNLSCMHGKFVIEVSPNRVWIHNLMWQTCCACISYACWFTMHIFQVQAL